MEINQYQIILENLDPTIGSEIQKTRPCVVVSPNEMLSLAHEPARIVAIPCCRLRHGFVNRRRRMKVAHALFKKPQAGKTGLAESPAAGIIPVCSQ